jgi:hypothetical protein
MLNSLLADLFGDFAMSGRFSSILAGLSRTSFLAKLAPYRFSIESRAWARPGGRI